jgi:hypothetical protein
MPDVSFGNLLVVVVIALAVPLLIGFVPANRVPSPVLLIVDAERWRQACCRPPPFLFWSQRVRSGSRSGPSNRSRAPRSCRRDSFPA